jgi:Putative zinc finger in N-recognin (UBR box)
MQAIKFVSARYDSDPTSVTAFLSSLSGNNSPVLTPQPGHGPPVSLSDYLSAPASTRPALAPVQPAAGPLLDRAAAVFALADASAATSLAELEAATAALEYVLAVPPDSVPAIGVDSLVRVPLLARTPRARSRRGLLSGPDAGSEAEVPTISALLASVGGQVRLCDIVAQTLRRTSLHDKALCVNTVSLTTRVLALAARFPQDASSTVNNLEPVIESATLRLGAMVVHHLDIDPASWLQTAAEVLPPTRTNERSRVTLLLAPLFGGMLPATAPYLEAHLEVTLTARVATVLSTLLVVLDALEDGGKAQSGALRVATIDAFSSASIHPAWISAALVFLGGHVVSFGDELADTVQHQGYLPDDFVACVHACDVYVHRSMLVNTHGRDHESSTTLLRLATAFLSAAAQQCEAEAVADADADTMRSTSEPGLGHDDEDNSTSGSMPLRSESSRFAAIDVFDLRSPTKSGTPSTMAPPPPPPPPPLSLNPHADPHRQVGVLALDVLTALLGLLVRSPSSLPESLSSLDKSQVMNAILYACESTGKFSCQTRGPLTSSFRSLSVAQQSCLLTAMSSFGDAASVWMYGGEVLSDEPAWSRFAVSLAPMACPVNLLGSLLRNAPDPILVASSVADSFVRRLLSGPDSSLPVWCIGYWDDCEEEKSVVMYAASLMTKEAAATSLGRVLDKMQSATCDTEPPRIGEEVSTEAVTVALAFVYFILLGATHGEKYARVCLRHIMNAIEISADGRSGEHEHRIEADILESGATCDIDNTFEDEFRDECARLPQIIGSLVNQVVGFIWSTPFESPDFGHSGWSKERAARTAATDSALQQCRTWLYQPSQKRCSASSTMRVMEVLIQVAYGSIRCARRVSGVEDEWLSLSQSEGSRPILATAFRIAPSNRRNSSIVHDADRLPGLFGVMDDCCRQGSHLCDIAGLFEDILSGPVCVLEDIFALDVRITLFLNRYVDSSNSSELLSAQMSLVFNGLERILHRYPALADRQVLSPVSSATPSHHNDAYLRQELLLRAGSYSDAAIKHGSPLCVPVFSLLVDQICALIVHLASARNIMWSPDSVLAAGVVIAVASGYSSGGGVEEASCCWLQDAAARATHLRRDSVALNSARSSIVHGCKLLRLIEAAPRSRHDMDSLMAFAVLESSADDAALNGFRPVLGSASHESYNECEVWICSVLPQSRLDTILEQLLIPPDYSAVCVDAAARSLGSLSRLCESHLVWRSSVSSSLASMCGASNGSFFSRLCERSILNSVGMADVVTDFVSAAVSKNIQSDSVSLAGRTAWLFPAYESVLRVIHDKLLVIGVDAVRRAVEFAAVLASLGQFISANDNIVESEVTEACRAATGNQLFACFTSELGSLTSALWCSQSGKIVETCHDGVAKTVFIIGAVHAVDCRVRSRSDEPDVFGGERVVSAGTGSKLSVGLCIPSSVVAPQVPVTKTCTFTSTGSQYIEQHWYFCYTCSFVGSEGVCATCAQVCHEGHDISYSRFSRFFCDCGASSGEPNSTANASGAAAVAAPGSPSILAGTPASRTINADDRRGARVHPLTPNASGVQRSYSSDAIPSSKSKIRFCSCLKPRTALSSSCRDGEALFDFKHHEFASTDDRLVWSRLSARLPTCPHSCSTASEAPPGSCAVATVLESRKLVSALSTAARGLLVRGHRLRDIGPAELMPAASDVESRAIETISGSRESVACVNRIAKMGSFSAERRNMFSDSSGSGVGLVAGARGSRLSLSRAGDRLVIVETSGKIGVMEVLNYFGTDSLTSAEHADLRRVCTIDPPFASIHAARINPECSSYLLLSGDDAVSVITIGLDGEMQGRVDIALGLADVGGALLRADWVPGSTHLVLVVTQAFAKIFDLSEDSMSPVYYANAQSESILDAVVACSSDKSFSYTLVVASASGKIFVARLVHGGESLLRYCTELSESVSSGLHPDNVLSPRRPLSLALSVNPDLLWLMCTDGSVVVTNFPLTQGVPIRRFLGVTPSGNGCHMLQLPDTSACMMFSARRKGTPFTGVMQLTPGGVLHYQTIDGSATVKVEGFGVIAPSRVFGFPLAPSCAVWLSDGSMLLLQMTKTGHLGDTMSSSLAARSIDRNCPAAMPDIVEEMRVDANYQYRQGLAVDVYDGMAGLVPSTVGFFEVCRRMSDGDWIIIGGDVSNISSPDRITSTPAVISSTAVATPPARHGFVSNNARSTCNLVVQCTDEAAVLCGVRIQVGVTELSRTQRPSSIRVFGREVKWSHYHDLKDKRWIDVPFAVPEYVASTQVVVLELEPRRQHDNSFVGNGTVMFDALEVYSISGEEAAERKRKLRLTIDKHTSHRLRAVNRRRLLRQSESQVDLWTPTAPADMDMFSVLDTRWASLHSCLRILSMASFALPFELSFPLKLDYYTHGILLAASADQRYSLAPTSQLFQVASKVKADHSSLSVSVCDAKNVHYAASVMSSAAYDIATKSLRSGLSVSPRALERAISLVSLSTRALLDCGCQPLSIDTSGIDLLCRAYSRLPSSDILLLISQRDVVTNLMDSLLGVSMANVSMDHAEFDKANTCILDLITRSSDNVTRVFASRRLVDFSERVDVASATANLSDGDEMNSAGEEQCKCSFVAAMDNYVELTDLLSGADLLTIFNLIAYFSCSRGSSSQGHTNVTYVRKNALLYGFSALSAPTSIYVEIAWTRGLNPRLDCHILTLPIILSYVECQTQKSKNHNRREGLIPMYAAKLFKVYVRACLKMFLLCVDLPSLLMAPMPIASMVLSLLMRRNCFAV